MQIPLMIQQIKGTELDLGASQLWNAITCKHLSQDICVLGIISSRANAGGLCPFRFFPNEKEFEIKNFE